MANETRTARRFLFLALVATLGTRFLMGAESVSSETAIGTQRKHPAELYQLARRYAKGAGVERDLKKAANLLRESAEQGYAAAQTDLAAAYANGSGVAQDYAISAEWYKKAAEAGDVLARYTLGRIYLQGRGVPQNSDLAVKWLKQAVEQNQIDAMLALGDLYLNGGPGVKPDYEQARLHFQKAADMGCVAALNSVGFLYEHGSGVPRDLKRARELFQEAADQGDGRGQMNLGRMYLEGQGTETDVVEAYKWFNLALRNGELVAKHFLQEIQARVSMTEEQVREGEQRIQDFLKTHKRRPSSNFSDKLAQGGK